MILSNFLLGEKCIMNKRVEIILFLVYSFGISFICICLMKGIAKYDIYGVITLILYGIEGATPSLAAIIVLLQKYGISGTKHFVKSKFVDGFNIKICVIGFCVPALVLTVGKLLTYITPYHNEFITCISPKKLIVVMWALIAEELGWRGYLQDKLEDKFGKNFTPLILGIIWVAWHFHFFISGSMEVPIILFAYGCIAESYGYFVITKIAKGNIIPASLWHFSGNLFFNLYRINPNWNNGRIEPYLIISSIYFLYFIVFFYYVNYKKISSFRENEKKDN